MCCAIKPMSSWHLNKTVRMARERCGGQGYLSINRSVISSSPSRYNYEKFFFCLY